jgi:hypothetical protein
MVTLLDREAPPPHARLLRSKFVRHRFGRFLRDLEALRLRITLAVLGILHRAFGLLNHVETSKTVSNYYLVLIIIKEIILANMSQCHSAKYCIPVKGLLLPDTPWILTFSRRATAGHQPGHGGTEPEEKRGAPMK